MTVQDGALVVTGENRAGVGIPMGGRDLDARRAVHAARGLLRPGGDSILDAGGWGAVLGDAAIRPDPAGPPPTVTFVAPEEWTQVEIRLEDFPTATPEIIAGLAFVAEGPAGGFEFEVDEVEMR